MKRLFILLILSGAVASIGYGGATMWKPSKQTSEGAEESARGKVQLSGTVIHKSDVATIPDSPYSAGTVLAVPSFRWDELMDRIDLHGPLQHAQFAMRKETFDEFVAGATTIERDGRYQLNLNPGRYVICVGNLGGSPPDSQAYAVSINGCLEPVMVEGKRKLIEISFGESGVEGR